jgi:hypothetical protein
MRFYAVGGSITRDGPKTPGVKAFTQKLDHSTLFHLTHASTGCLIAVER